jgi:protein-disulfide isomerase
MGLTMSQVNDRAVRRFRLRGVIDVIAAVAMLVTALVLLFYGSTNGRLTRTQQSALQLPTELVQFGASSQIGDQQARVVVILFSDFECPACKRFALREWPSFRQRWIDSSKVQMSFRHFPNVTTHPMARHAAEAASCAGLQKLF